METETTLKPPLRLINLFKNYLGIFIFQDFYVGFEKQIKGQIQWREINNNFHLSKVTYEKFHEIKADISNRELLINNVSSIYPKKRLINSETQLVLVAGFEFRKDKISYNISIIFSSDGEKYIVNNSLASNNDSTTFLLTDIIPSLSFAEFRLIVENLMNKVSD